jgi:hypothetical protein
MCHHIKKNKMFILLEMRNKYITEIMIKNIYSAVMLMINMWPFKNIFHIHIQLFHFLQPHP